MKAVLFPVDGEPTVVDHGTDLADLQRTVGGSIEMVRLPGTDVIAWINEDGKGLDLPRNRPATDLLLSFGAIFRTDWIAGPALFCSVRESQDLEQVDVDALLRLAVSA